MTWDGKIPGDGRSSGKENRYGRDFLTGCLVIALILAILFIGIPIFVLLLKISFILVLPIGLLLCLVLLAVFLGRIINVFREK